METSDQIVTITVRLQVEDVIANLANDLVHLSARWMETLLLLVRGARRDAQAQAQAIQGLNNVVMQVHRDSLTLCQKLERAGLLFHLLMCADVFLDAQDPKGLAVLQEESGDRVQHRNPPAIFGAAQSFVGPTLTGLNDVSDQHPQRL